MRLDIMLMDQPRGKALEYRVLSLNMTGKCLPSNTVVVL